MDQGRDQYFAVIGEGARLLASLDEDSASFFADLARLREILAMLEDAPAPVAKPIPLTFSLADREASAASLRAYMDTGIADLPDVLKTYEAETVSDLAIEANDVPLAQEAGRYNGGNKMESKRLAVAGFMTSRGVGHGLDHESIQAAAAAASAVLDSANIQEDPGYISARAAYRIAVNASNLRMQQIRQEMRNPNLSDDEAQALNLEYKDISRKDGGRAVAAADAHRDKKIAQFKKDVADKAREATGGQGQALIDLVHAASPISMEAATAWANEQVIDDTAIAKLKRFGYKPEQVRRDMAEFYRLTGGKASAIRVGSGRARANAQNVDTRVGEKVITLGAHFNKTVLFHELAHHLENDPIAKAAANGFLIKRRESEKVYSLRSLTGNKGYDMREVAWKDSFMNPYIGKRYADGITEVFSMGLQYLANPTDAAIFAAKDPEMFNLITGYLTMKTTPAMAAKLNMHSGVIEEQQEAKRTEDEQYADAAVRLAASAHVEKDDWFDTLDRESEYYDLLAAYILRKDKTGMPNYVGSVGPYKVFSGTFKNGNTKRFGKGYMVVNSVVRSSVGDYRTIPDYAIAGPMIEDAQLLIALANVDGIGISNAFRAYLSETWDYLGKRKSKVIAASEKLQ